MDIKTEEDLLAQMDSMQSQYGDKFLKEIHPLIKKYYNTTGNDFEYKIYDEIIIKYDGGHYWVCEGPIFSSGPTQSGLWFDEKGIDSLGRKYGGERNSAWFNLVARLCCKYQKEIKSKIIYDLQDLMK